MSNLEKVDVYEGNEITRKTPLFFSFMKKGIRLEWIFPYADPFYFNKTAVWLQICKLTGIAYIKASTGTLFTDIELPYYKKISEHILWNLFLTNMMADVIF